MAGPVQVRPQKLRAVPAHVAAQRSDFIVAQPCFNASLRSERVLARAGVIPNRMPGDGRIARAVITARGDPANRITVAAGRSSTTMPTLSLLRIVLARVWRIFRNLRTSGFTPGVGSRHVQTLGGTLACAPRSSFSRGLSEPSQIRARRPDKCGLR